METEACHRWGRGPIFSAISNITESHHVNKLSEAGLLIALGIIYGDIGTSSWYVMKAIVGSSTISQTLV
ncbi:hypothetical protein FJM65_11990 [Pontibacter mangrovi]|uniref:Uncharacterized protein n=1 Tax=Pontibacter mangrovi TaxID=2589816 RepID=A0A501WDA3_9BACT|nr:hypothetical protein FJM65_11990 [Pontibacter mangrovi]